MTDVVTTARIPSTTTALLLVGRGVAIETIRRKEFYVLLILMGFYVLAMGVAALVGIENQSTLVFLLNLGITFAYLAAHLLTLLSAARQIPSEIENRTLYPLLAKPLSRAHYILGKWLATTASGVCVFIVLFAMSWMPWALFNDRPDFQELLLAQAFVANILSLALISAMALLMSLVMPHGTNMTLLGILFFAGSKIINFVNAGLLGTAFEKAGRWVTAYLPNFNNLALFNRYTDGVAPLEPLAFGGVVAYGAVFTAAALALAIHLFNRRPL